MKRIWMGSLRSSPTNMNNRPHKLIYIQFTSPRLCDSFPLIADETCRSGTATARAGDPRRRRGGGAARPRPTRTPPRTPAARHAGGGAATAAGAAAGGTPRPPPATRAAAGARIPGRTPAAAADAGGGVGAGGARTSPRSRSWSTWPRRRRRRYWNWAVEVGGFPLFGLELGLRSRLQLLNHCCW